MITLCKNISHELVNKKIEQDFPDHDIVRLYDIQQESSRIQHELTSENIFQIPKVIILARIHKDFWDVIIESFQFLPDTTKVFWIEETFPVATVRKISNNIIWEEKVVKQEKQNPFVIANTLATADAKNLWTTYHELLAEGNDPEGIFGILWWKLKDMTKKKKVISEDLKNTFHEFMKVYAESREQGNLEMNLEQLLLSITKKDLI